MSPLSYGLLGFAVLVSVFMYFVWRGDQYDKKHGDKK